MYQHCIQTSKPLLKFTFMWRIFAYFIDYHSLVGIFPCTFLQSKQFLLFSFVIKPGKYADKIEELENNLGFFPKANTLEIICMLHFVCNFSDSVFKGIYIKNRFDNYKKNTSQVKIIWLICTVRTVKSHTFVQWDVYAFVCVCALLLVLQSNSGNC